MNLEIASLWTAALRSGEYKQTTQRLCSNNSFCCLGVLTELYMATPNSLVQRDDDDGNTTYYSYDDEEEDAQLPRPVMLWAGMFGDLGELNKTELSKFLTPGDVAITSLATLNDDSLTFAQIADVIDYVAADL